ncbi:MAG: prephenate/arogenate dehydrogenase [Cyanobacteria bacterium P01_F01_bin.4]
MRRPYPHRDLCSEAKSNTMKIGIVGLGLIGGCLGLDLRRAGHWVYGVSRRQETCTTAENRGVVDVAATALAGLGETELVFVCTPIAMIEPMVVQLAAVLPAATVITDVGSVKASIVAAATRLWPRFVGGHPMAGKAEAGIEAAETNLFAGRPYVLTPIATTDEGAISQVRDVAQQLGSHLYSASPENHDQAVAWISHLPVMVSASLIQACLSEPDSAIQILAQQLASSGFRDTSRVGGGNPELGLMMAQYNRQAMLKSLLAYRQQLDGCIQALQTEDWMVMADILRQAQEQRSRYVS